jgi:putative metallohydrolase (TIGR04338 family)
VKRERDSQRGKLYSTECVLSGRRFDSLEACRIFAEGVMRSAVVRRNYPEAVAARWPRSLTVKDGRGRRKAGGWEHGIALPLWARCEEVILHELAHVINERLHKLDAEANRAPHGWQFAGIMLNLVKWFLGAAEWRRLRAAFRWRGVRWKPKRQRPPLTEAQKEALRERLAAARLVRKAAKSSD